MENQNGFNAVNLISVNEIKTNSVYLNYNMTDETGSLLNSMFRFGLQYRNGTFLSGYRNFNSEPLTIDTLYSSETNYSLPVDSVNRKQFGYDLSGQQIYTEFVYYRTNTHRDRLSGYIGVGIGASLITGLSTNLTFIQDVVFSPEPYVSDILLSQNQSGNGIAQERIKHNNGYTLAAILPIGFSFPLSKKESFWQYIHATAEMKNAIQFVDIPDAASTTNYFIEFSYGIKFRPGLCNGGKRLDSH